MFCAKCGTKMEDGVTQCPNCGYENAGSTAQNTGTNPAYGEAPAPSAGTETGQVFQSAPGPVKTSAPVAALKGEGIKKLLKNKWVIGGLLALIVAIIVIIIVVLQPKKFNLEEYVTISYDGYDGYATAYASIDRGKLYNDIYAAKGKKTDVSDYSSLESIGTALQDDMKIEQAVDTISLEITSENGNLSNGDTVTVAITYDNTVAKKAKIKFKGESVSLEITGLESVVEVDPFEGLQVSFYGVAPFGYMEYSYSGDTTYVSDYSFSYDKADNLRNGDVVTFTVNMDDESTLYNGYILTQKEMQYTVEGLDEYVESFADLSEDFIAELKSEAEDAIYAYTANSYDAATALSDLAYSGYILNSLKPDAYGNSNYLYIIYSGTVSNTNGEFRATKVYYPVCFTNVMKSAESQSYESKDGIVGYSNIDGTWSSTQGYVNPLTCYAEIVEANRDSYTAECGDGFEVYSQYETIGQLADIDDTFRTQMYTEAKEAIESYISGYSESSNVTDLAVLGEYLMIAKTQSADFANNNRYYIVYSATLSNSNDDFETTTVYYPVEYDGVVKLPSGEYVITASKGIVGYSRLNDSFFNSYSTNGYIDGPTMYSEIVTANRDNYTYEVSEGLKQFGE